MAHSVPHLFKTLRSGLRPTNVFIGAGFSYGLVPLPAHLLKERGLNAESLLRINTGILPKAAYNAEDLYHWADSALAAISSWSNPKLSLATALSIPGDDQFAALFSIAPSKPRHRILARLVREKLINHIWTTNWDCYIENALQRCGMKCQSQSVPVPWITSQISVVTASELPMIGQNKAVVFKPHGCARSLCEAQAATQLNDPTKAKQHADRFLIGAQELSDTTKSSSATFIYGRLEADINSDPLIVAGWSASESYLQDFLISSCLPAKATQALEADECSIVDIQWSAGHANLADIYKSSQSNSFVQVEDSSPGFTSDHLFRWIYALFALDQLIEVAEPTDGAHLIMLRDQLEANKNASEVTLDWFDYFLPAWIRFCCRQGHVVFKIAGAPIDLSNVPMDSPEESIPFRIQNRDVADMKAASKVLSTLIQNGNLDVYDYRSCPGALVNCSELTFLMPFDGGSVVNDLRNDPHMDKMWDTNDIILAKLCMIPIGPQPTATGLQKSQAQSVVSSLMRSRRFADPSRIALVDEVAL